MGKVKVRSQDSLILRCKEAILRRDYETPKRYIRKESMCLENSKRMEAL